MTSHLQHTSIRYYRRYYRLIVIAIIVMMTVLTGSVVTGDSVRGTLTDRVEERLAGTQTLITSGTGFLNDDILQSVSTQQGSDETTQQGNAEFSLLHDATAYLLMDGFVSIGEKLLPVFVWGTDDNTLSNGEIWINESLSRRIEEEDVVLHLPSHSLVPSGTLFVTQSYSTQMRLHVKGVKTNEQGGNLLLHNEQTRPLNIFMRRSELAEKMEIPGKINIIMSPSYIDESDFRALWQPTHSGLKIENNAVTADRIFLPSAVVSTLQPQRILSAYLVNNIFTADNDTTTDVPYSFVTATNHFAGMELRNDDVVLSDYAAQRLRVNEGDSVMMEYFVTHNLKSLHTRTHSFYVKAVLPLSAFQNDTLLSTEFPGLSHVERCTDWDSDLPINMGRIEKQDEDFWYKYKQTPKAVVAYDAVSEDWNTSFGVATAITVADMDEAAKSLQPQMMGVVVVHPREASLYAAQHGTDFSGLFLALGAFIIMAAVLLMQSPMVEMLNQRREEIQLYAQLGYTRQRIHHILLSEQMRVLPLATLVGTFAGILYAAMMLFLLGNVWSGATHTDGFTLHLDALSIALTYIAGLAICLLTAWLTIRSFLKEHKQKGVTKHPSSMLNPRCLLYIAVLLATLCLFGCNLFLWHSLIVFVTCGMLWLIFTALLVMHIIALRANQTHASFTRSTMLWKSIHASRSQWLLSYWSLSVGVFTVLSVGLNRPDFSHAVDDDELTNGCQLWCDLRIPMEYDLNNPDVRRKLSLTDLPDSTYFIQCLRHTEDEASCLNLNRVSTPTVVAIQDTRPSTRPPSPLKGETNTLRTSELRANQNTSYQSSSQHTPDQTSSQHTSDQTSSQHTSDQTSSQHTSDLSSAPYEFISPFRGLGGLGLGLGLGLYLDQESLIWSVMKSVGDTLTYTAADGSTVPLPILDSYPTGIFHGNAIMSAELFRTLWPEESGSKILLVHTPEGKEEEVTSLLEVALSQYGIRVTTTTERLQQFFTVTDTYLSIFLILGGLGMIVGIFSLIITLRKALISRRQQIDSLRSLGYDAPTLRNMLFRECFIIPLCAIILGAMGSLISISANVGGVGWGTWLTAALFLMLLFALIFSGIQSIIRKTV